MTRKNRSFFSKITVFSLVFSLFNTFVFSQTASAVVETPDLLEINLLQHANDASYHDGEVIVQYKKNINLKKPAGQSEADKTEKSVGATPIDTFDNLNIKVLQTSQSVSATIEQLKQNPDIDFVEPNYKRSALYTPNDSFFTALWGLNNTGQSVNGISGTLGEDIKATQAWDTESPSSGTTTVAVIDFGVNYNHPDLVANMWDGTTCKDQYNVLVVGGCPNHGWNFETNTNDPIDAIGHGSMVSGIIGATTDNATGVSGTSRYNHTKIMALRFAGFLSEEIAAINFAKNNGAKIINASFGGPDFSQIEKNTIDAFPGLVIAASGNDGRNTDTNTIHNYPSDYTSTNIISVASVNQNDRISSFSNVGPTSVDVAAPGENIVTLNNVSTYSYGSGTSLAAPYVSGIAALMYEKNPSLSIDQARYIILNSGDDLQNAQDKVSLNSGKRVNMRNALNQASSISAIPIATPIYRFWSDDKQHHFFTASAAERDSIIATYPPHVWNYEGVAYSAFTQPITDALPVYRFWSDEKQGHFYTISETEKNSIIATYPTNVWKYEGIAFYAYPNQKADTTPVYRFWSDTKQGHFYTASLAEKDSIIATYPTNVWKYEGIAYYVPK